MNNFFFFILKVKAVGSKDESRKEEIILKKIGKAVDGLKKDTEILTSVMTRSSYSKGMQMQLVVALPNVSRTQLEEVRACSKRKLKVEMPSLTGLETCTGIPRHTTLARAIQTNIHT